MYCVKCGVKLGDTEKKCPLCNTVVYHPEIMQKDEGELYPSGKMPSSDSGRAFLCGALIIMFMIPIIVSFFSDIQFDGSLDWFGYVAGALLLAYLTFAFPMWFKSPNPVIFVPCDFLAVALYLLYIDISTSGGWFLSFALPVTVGIGMVSCALVTLLRYLHRGQLYAIGGGILAFGVWILMVEALLCSTFDLRFIGWSIYPLISLICIGGLVIYFASSRAAREIIERKIFF